MTKNKKVTTEDQENYLTQDEFKKIADLVSPTPLLDEYNMPLKDKSGNLKYEEVDPEDVKYINDVLFKKNVTVGTVIQLATLFVNNLRQFTINNFQGLMDTQEIQKRIAHELGATHEIEEKVVSKFNEEIKEQEEKSLEAIKKAKKEEMAKDSK